MVPGDPAVRDQWGTVYDNTMAVIEQAIAGGAPISIDGLAAYPLTTANNAPDQARQMIYMFTGALSGTCTITIPAVPKIMLVRNATTGGHLVTLTTGVTGGRTASVMPGLAAWLMCDGTNVDLPTIAGDLPIGSLQTFAGATAPPRWLVCDGRAVSRSTYALLYGVIGTTYGVGDGGSTFNIPDMRSRAMFGLDNMGGTAAGRVTSASGMPGTTLGGAGGNQLLTSHTHNITDPGHTHGVTTLPHSHRFNDP